MKKKFLILVGIVFLGVFSKMPYHYYTFLRFSIILFSGYILLEDKKTLSDNWKIFFIGTMILYSPFIHLAKEMWNFINFITLIAFWYYCYKIKKS